MSTRDLAGELTAQGHTVPAETVDRLLHALDRRRGHRPPGTRPRPPPRHTLPGKLTAAILRDRHGLPRKQS